MAETISEVVALPPVSVLDADLFLANVQDVQSTIASGKVLEDVAYSFDKSSSVIV